MPNTELQTLIQNELAKAAIAELVIQRDAINKRIAELQSGAGMGNGLLGPGDSTRTGRRGRRKKTTTGVTATGNPGKKRGPKPKAKKGGYKDITKAQLLSLLSSNKGTVNRQILNAAGFNLVSAIQIAKDEPSKLTFKKNGAQGSVSSK